MEAMDVLTEAMDVLTVSLLTAATGFLTVATDFLTEDMEATDVGTMERGRLRLLPRLRPIPTMALTDMVDFLMEATDVLTEAMDVLTVFLLMVVMAALTEDMEATDVATMARGGLRLLLRPRLLTDTAMAAAMEATAAPTEDMVATGPMALMAALTGMATESRQQPEHQNHMNNLKLLNMNLTK